MESSKESQEFESLSSKETLQMESFSDLDTFNFRDVPQMRKSPKYQKAHKEEKTNTEGDFIEPERPSFRRNTERKVGFQGVDLNQSQSKTEPSNSASTTSTTSTTLPSPTSSNVSISRLSPRSPAVAASSHRIGVPPPLPLDQGLFFLDEELEREQRAYRARKAIPPRDLFFDFPDDDSFLVYGDEGKPDSDTPSKKLFGRESTTDDEFDNFWKQNWARFKTKLWVVGYRWYRRYRRELLFGVFFVAPLDALAWTLADFGVDARIGGESLIHWSLAITYGWLIVIGAHLVVHFLWTILSRIFNERMDHLYIISGLTAPLVFLISSIVFKVTWYQAFPHIHSDAEMFMHRLLTLLIVIAVFYCVSRLAQKFISAHTNTQTWHDQLRIALLREQLLEKLMTPPIPEPTVETGFFRGRLFSRPIQPELGDVPLTTFSTSLSPPPSPPSSSPSLSLNLQNSTLSPRERQINFQMELRMMEDDSFLNPSWGSPTEVLIEKAKWTKAERSEKARMYAIKIWANLVQTPDQEALSASDFHRVLQSYELTKQAVELFDIDDNGEITKRGLVIGLKAMFELRKDLVDTLRDRDNISSILRNLFTVLFWFVNSIAALVVFERDVQTAVYSTITLMLALSFAFGRVLRHIVLNIVLIFITNPFDVGDRLIVPDVDKTPLRVAKINLMTTLLNRRDGQLFSIPNFMFYERPFSNLKRSKLVYYPFQFTVHYSTTALQLKALKEGIKFFLEKNRLHFGARFEFVVHSVKETNGLNLFLWVELKTPWQETERTFKLKTQFHLLFQRLCKENGVVHYDIPQRLELHGASILHFLRDRV